MKTEILERLENDVREQSGTSPTFLNDLDVLINDYYEQRSYRRFWFWVSMFMATPWVIVSVLEVLLSIIR